MVKSNHFTQKKEESKQKEKAPVQKYRGGNSISMAHQQLISPQVQME
jgi:hypothetical protein